MELEGILRFLVSAAFELEIGFVPVDELRYI
jgi:hypothetical protein